MYPSPHGAHGPPPNALSERQRQILEMTAHHRQNFVPQHPVNGGGHPAGYFNYSAPSPFQPQNVPQLPPPDNLNDKQRQARDLINQLNQDKKMVLQARKKLAAELKIGVTSLNSLEATKDTGNYRHIYPLQIEIAQKQYIHDEYGREWDKVEELLEICWAELMAPS